MLDLVSGYVGLNWIITVCSDLERKVERMLLLFGLVHNREFVAELFLTE